MYIQKDSNVNVTLESRGYIGKKVMMGHYHIIKSSYALSLLKTFSEKRFDDNYSEFHRILAIDNDLKYLFIGWIYSVDNLKSKILLLLGIVTFQ